MKAIADNGLRYMKDIAPGFGRRRSSKGFVYISTDGSILKDDPVIDRILGLAIPPAWTDVWISPSPCGHIQATGRDAKGRKQYIYHRVWNHNSAETKFNRLVAFGHALPAMRRTTERDLARKGLPRPKILAIVVRLLERTLIRIGNREYVRDNDSFGLSTLRHEHIEIAGEEIFFHFHGKSGKEHAISLQDRRLSRIIMRLQEIPGQELFQYYDDDFTHREVGSEDVNDYLREISGQDFTAKEFRTWGGTHLAATVLWEMGPGATRAAAKKKITEAVKYAAKRLGNRPSVCSKYYIHPAVTDSYLKGVLGDYMAKGSTGRQIQELNPSERGLLALLEQHRLEPAAGGPVCTE